MPLFKLLAAGGLLALTVMLLDAREQNQPEQGTDVYGDPLPPGALVRCGTVRWRHCNITCFVAFLPDGKSVLSADYGEVIHIWEYPSGKELRRFGPGVTTDSRVLGRVGFGPQGFGAPVSLSRDGKILVCQFDYGDLFVYDVASGKIAAKLGFDDQGGKDSRFNSAAISPDSKHIAVQEEEGDLQIWDWAKGKVVHHLMAPVKNIDFPPCRPVYSPDGKLVATTMFEEIPNNNVVKSTIKLWDADKGQEVRSIIQQGEEILIELQFSPNGKALAGRRDDGLVQLWDVATGKLLLQFKSGNFLPLSMVFAKDGKSIITRGFDLTVREWDASTGKELRKLGPVGDRSPYFVDDQSLLVLSPDGKTLGWAGEDHGVHFLDLTSGKARADGRQHDGHDCARFWT